MNNKGSVLITAMIVFIVTAIIITGAMTITAGSYRRAWVNENKAQAYYTALSTLNMFCDAILASPQTPLGAAVISYLTTLDTVDGAGEIVPGNRFMTYHTNAATREANVAAAIAADPIPITPVGQPINFPNVDGFAVGSSVVTGKYIQLIANNHTFCDVCDDEFDPCPFIVAGEPVHICDLCNNSGLIALPCCAAGITVLKAVISLTATATVNGQTHMVSRTLYENASNITGSTEGTETVIVKLPGSHTEILDGGGHLKADAHGTHFYEIPAGINLTGNASTVIGYTGNTQPIVIFIRGPRTNLATGVVTPAASLIYGNVTWDVRAPAVYFVLGPGATLNLEAHQNMVTSLDGVAGNAPNGNFDIYILHENRLGAPGNFIWPSGGGGWRHVTIIQGNLDNHDVHPRVAGAADRNPLYTRRKPPRTDGVWNNPYPFFDPFQPPPDSEIVSEIEITIPVRIQTPTFTNDSALARAQGYDSGFTQGGPRHDILP